MRLTDFDALSFDCYGTLIDWEAGLAAVLRRWASARGLDLDAEALLAAYSRHEEAAEAAHPQEPYPAILARSLRDLGGELGAEVSEQDAQAPGALGARLAGLPRLARRAGRAGPAVPADHPVERGPGLVRRPATGDSG